MLSLLRRGGVLRRAFHSARVACMADEPVPTYDIIEFKWQHLVTPYTPPEFVSRMKQMEQSLSALRSELTGAPDSIEDINWAEWEEKISDRAALEQIKTSYENFTPEESKTAADVDALNADIDKIIAQTSASDKLVGEMVAEYRAELAQAKREKPLVPTWKFHDFLNRYPGLAEECRHEYMEGYQLPPESLERLAEGDLAEMRRTVRTGGRLSTDEDIPNKVGDFDYELELKKTEELARKMLPADSPKLREFIDIVRKEQLAVRKPDDNHAPAAAHH